MKLKKYLRHNKKKKIKKAMMGNHNSTHDPNTNLVKIKKESKKSKSPKDEK